MTSAHKPELLSPSDIAALLNIPTGSMKRLLATPGFPAPTINVSQKARRWMRQDVAKWLDAQHAKNSKAPRLAP